MSRIIVVDDNPTNRKYLATLLEYFGHEVIEAGDGVEALESIRHSNVNLVITDVLMPVMDGYDLLHHLRADRAVGGTPVIFYTAAEYESEARTMAEAAGVEHFLTKPADPQVILAAVNAALGHGALEVSPVVMTKFHRRLLAAPSDSIDPNAVVFVVDDDPTVLKYISAILYEANLTVETFATAEAFLQGYDATKPSCLVLDISLPGINGIELLEVLRSRRNHIPTIILTGHGNTNAAVGALRLQAMDFLEKPVDRRILMTRIYRALQEDSIKRREHAQVESIRQRMALLTVREKELLKLVVLGRSSKEIAAELQISVKTVSHHRAHLMSKTDAENLADLVRMTMIALDE